MVDKENKWQSWFMEALSLSLKTSIYCEGLYLLRLERAQGSWALAHISKHGCSTIPFVLLHESSLPSHDLLGQWHLYFDGTFFFLAPKKVLAFKTICMTKIFPCQDQGEKWP